MKLETSKIGFVGAGNMANSLIRGLLQNSVAAENLWAADIDSAKLDTLNSECGIRIAASRELAGVVDVLILAVKPQVMASVCADLFAALKDRNCLIISIAAGINLDHLQRWLGESTAIVRCMPNTPALVGKGATGLVANRHVSATQKILAAKILAAVGIAIWLDKESDIDAVTALSGSGPAYFFLLMEALQDSAVSMGLSKDVARQLIYQTALGAAVLAASSNLSTAQLRSQVTSPGGTTEQAIAEFENGGLRELVDKAVHAAERRSRELGSN